MSTLIILRFSLPEYPVPWVVQSLRSVRGAHVFLQNTSNCVVSTFTTPDSVNSSSASTCCDGRRRRNVRVLYA